MSSDSVAVNPEMVILARESRGLSQAELADRLSIGQSQLSRIENGTRSVSQAVLHELSQVLRYRPEFFTCNDVIMGFGPSLLYHRKRQQAPIKLLNRLNAEANVRRIQLSRLLQALDIGDVMIQPLDLADFGDDPERVADAVRASLRLPDGPLHNLTKAIEDARGIVIPLDTRSSNIDAVSMWPPGMPPLFFVNSQSPPDRLRFTLAHELGHIVMHRVVRSDRIEDEADRFASELLMPAKQIRPYLTNLTLSKLAQLKPYWRVSMAALIRKASDLGTISESAARSLWAELSKRGYRKREPDLGLVVEVPTLYREIVDIYRRELKYTAEEIGKMVYLSKEEVQEVYLGETKRLRLVRSNSG